MKTISYQTIDSTNIEAQRLLDSGEDLPFVVVAEEQTHGKGRGEHVWETESGKNLTCSFVVKPYVEPQYQYLITVATSLAILDLLSQYLSTENQIKIKWPNDIFVDDNKICGILIANRISGNEIKSSIIGIGVNVNQIDFPVNLPNATSLKKITNKEFDINELLSELIILLENNIIMIKDNVLHLRVRYIRNLYKLHQPMIYNVDGVEMECKISGIDEFGGIMCDK
ncbi:biotin--[acetyl-CoA-carboxylase] ligase [Odoribacter sp. OttesenSCG-928-L07]|nr:biotin--[acetyl-CoA-carboxylase] ligase [Odoribacter sp. OttesenSCG-928-L07]MDL2238725.1 biotin--[acetyl-CoA-carboxylase] ligase [Bacteroidales bacterium OttesenSCG-928-L14]